MRTHRLSLLASSVVIVIACSSAGPGGTAATGAGNGSGTGNNSGTAGSGAGTTASGTGGTPLTGTSSGTGASMSSGTGGASMSSSSGATGGASMSTSASGTGGASTSSSASGTVGSSVASSSSGTVGSSVASSSSGTGGGMTTFGGACSGVATALTGTVYAPNGIDPIPNVRVYAAISINPYPASYCDKCAAPIDPAYVATYTAADGTFSLNLASVPEGATITFAIQIGRFRKWTTLPVTACQTQAVPKAAETLPGANGANANIPKIAVSAGNVDHLDSVLTTLGITEYDCYEGRATPFYPYGGSCTGLSAASKTIADVLQNSTPGDPTAITSYHMAFISCAPDAYNHYVTPPPGGAGNNQAAMTNNTKSWVGNGGRLFVTDTAYDYIAQAFLPDITWAGPAGAPQPIDGANIGCAPAKAGYTSVHAVPYPLTVDDPTLSAWLALPAIGYPPPVSVNGFYEPWSAIASLPATTNLIANGPMMPVDPTITGGACTAAATQLQNVPLTAEFDVPTCGRVIFSSYHTYSSGSATSANEKIMEYLIFAAAVCHQ